MKTFSLFSCVMTLILMGCSNNGKQNAIDSTDSVKDNLSDSINSEMISDSITIPAPILTKNGIGAIQIGMKPQAIPPEVAGLYNQVMRSDSDYGINYMMLLNGEHTLSVFADYDDEDVWRIMIMSPSIIAELPDGKKLRVGEPLSEVIKEFKKSKFEFNTDLGACLEISPFWISITQDFTPAGEKKVDKVEEGECQLTPSDFTSNAKVEYIFLGDTLSDN